MSKDCRRPQKVLGSNSPPFPSKGKLLHLRNDYSFLTFPTPNGKRLIILSGKDQMTNATSLGGVNHEVKHDVFLFVGANHVGYHNIGEWPGNNAFAFSNFRDDNDGGEKPKHTNLVSVWKIEFLINQESVVYCYFDEWCYLKHRWRRNDFYRYFQAISNVNTTKE